MSRNEFLKYIALSLSAFAAAIVGGCSSQSAADAETEPSPEWPPAD